MKKAVLYLIIALGIFSSANSFAREAKTLKFLLDIPHDFCLSLGTPIINQNNSPSQDLYFDIDLTEEDNDDVSNSEKKKTSFAKIVFWIDPSFSRNNSEYFFKTIPSVGYLFPLTSFYFNSPIVLRL